jgi:pilus assembly protein FimV
MLRKLAVFIVSAGLTMSPLSVQALGFGGIKLKSSLNEKLNAEVALLSASANDIQSLSVKLATEEAFLRSGIDRTALLNKLKFKVKQRANGDYYIHVTTTETVREPFMNFLLELDWKNGRMLREYTMLIDPPGRAPKQIAAPAPVVAETMTPEPDVVAEPVEEPVVAMAEESSPFVEPAIEPSVEPAAPLPEYVPGQEVKAEMAPVVEPVEPAPSVVDVVPEMDLPPEVVFEEEASDELWPRIALTPYNEADDSFNDPVTDEPVADEPIVDYEVAEAERGDLDYGITKANDNLWNIAEKLRQGDESISVYQVMMALLQSNPDAFVDNNVHRLKVGHVLRIEDSSALTSLTAKEAADSFIEQTESWNSYRQQVAEAAGVQPIIAGSDVASDDGMATETSGELTLSSPDGESLTAGGGVNEESLSNDLATMQDQLRQAKSDAGTMRTRNVALNDKLQSLEDELNRLQRSLSVKDDELAALQHQLSNLNIEPAKVPVQEQVAAEAPVVAEVEEPVVTEEVAKPEVTEEPVKAEVEEQAKAEKSPVELAAEIAKQEKAVDVKTDAEQGIMGTVIAVVTSAIATVTGVVTGMNLGSDSLLFILAPVGVVLLIIVVIVIRRRSKDDNFQESILTGAATASAEAGAPTNDSSTFSEESSFLSDFAMSGASAIEAEDSEVDPLTEADVFMAYGRYEAAEERLNEGVQSEPDRLELRAKLLELYHATQNKDAFESSAADFYARLDGKEAENPLWAKVVSLGSEIAPENPLFNQGGGAADISATGEVPAINDIGMDMTDSQVMDIGLETGVFAAADLTASTEIPGDDMDFNLDLGMDESTESASTETTEAADMDFNLDMGTEAEAAVTEDAGLDFNLDTDTKDTAAEEPAADLDLNLDMETTDSSDDGGLDFSLDFDSDSSGGEESLDLNLDAADTADADIGGGDEVGTKLDLAKAYIDMGDPEGARSILDEVMEEGNSSQKEEAQSLLGQIA